MGALAYKLPYTYEDYKYWEGRWELINGDAIAMAPSPFGPHQGVLTNIMFDISSSLKKCKNRCFSYAELDYIVDEFTVLRPDISIVCQKIKEFIRIAPKMVVEILSPSTAIKDYTIKYEIYEKEGIEFYLIVDYNLKIVKLYKLIDFKYRKIEEKTEGSFEVNINDCKINFNISNWWEMV